ncbi:NFYB/HAP3 family transcription factor subunit [Candidatus Woesearchaeota archaeon]|nr:NFYB/HAP3 family transcription factor subunit [Candidatus Woesearchaeota archaeon]
MSIIPSAAMERVLRKAGSKRVSENAKRAFAEILEKKAIEIGEQANKIAKNCGRKTVLGTDIKMVRL